MKSVILGLVFLVGTPIFAQSNSARQIADWSMGVISGATGMYAATFNDSGVAFGNYCYFKTQTCFWVLAINLRTEENARYPVLINSKKGAFNTVMICESAKSVGLESRCVFENPDVISEAVIGSGQIGFAFPLADGKFHVSRFSLAGGDEAVSSVRELVRRAGKGGTGTRDSRL